ncbi:MAG: VWA domain-containing protein [Pirellulales bacterium]|nr:VWA domain-containing protein [Pirellulales bacterium]
MPASTARSYFRPGNIGGNPIGPYFAEENTSRTGRNFVRGILQGGILLVTTAVFSYLISLTPGLASLVLDRDRAELEIKLSALGQAGDWPAVVDMISKRLDRPASRHWRAVLTQRLYDSLVSAGQAAAGGDAEQFFQRAITTARDHSLSDTLAVSQLERLHLARAYDTANRTAQRLTKQDVERQAALQNAAAQLAVEARTKTELQATISTQQTELQKLGHAVAQMKTDTETAKTAEQKARTDAQQAETRVHDAQAEVNTVRQAHITATFAMLLDWGDSLPRLHPLRKSRYDLAKAIAEEHALDPSPAIDRVAQWSRDEANAQPAVLPPGVRAAFRRVNTSTLSPITLVDLDIRLDSGQFMPNLKAKDFHVKHGTAFITPNLSTVFTPTGDRLSVVLLLDESNSTSGQPLLQVGTGAARLLTELQGQAELKVTAFATNLRPIADWTDKPSAYANRLQLAARGKTALMQALAQAVEDLQTRSGRRAIVLFTDGRDTVGGPGLAELITRCRQQQTTVHVIALQTAELDRDILTNLTQSTGGVLLPTAKSTELPELFRTAAAELRIPFYRLAFLEPLPDHAQLVIGKGPTALTITSLQTTQQ